MAVKKSTKTPTKKPKKKVPKQTLIQKFRQKLGIDMDQERALTSYLPLIGVLIGLMGKNKITKTVDGSKTTTGYILVDVAVAKLILIIISRIIET